VRDPALLAFLHGLLGMIAADRDQGAAIGPYDVEPNQEHHSQDHCTIAVIRFWRVA
jgi:hypothetical protein